MTDEENKIQEIKDRLSELETERRKFEGRWETVESYVASSVYSWGDLDAIPDEPKRFSADPCVYNKTLVSGLVGYSISPSIKWFQIALEDEQLMKLYGVKKWIDEVQKIMVSEFNRSNLYKEVTPWITDGTIVGHGVLMISENLHDNVLHFKHMRLNEIYLDINELGDVDTVFRKFNLTVRQLVKMFGLDNLDEKTREEYNERRARTNRHTILFAVYPREDAKYESKLSKDMPYAAIYVDLNTNKILQESGFRDFPYSIYEFNQLTDYAYSTSISWDALPDIRALNLCIETMLKVAQTAAEPPIKASDHLKNVSIRPRAVTRLSHADDVIEAIRTGENYPITIDIVNMFRERVKDNFNVDFFLMLQSQRGQPLTATQVVEMQGEKAAVLSDLIVSINNPLSKIIKRSFYLLMEAGRLPPPPDSLNGYSNVAMKIDFVGPLAQAQKKYYESGNATQALAASAPIMQIFPNSADYIDSDELIRQVMTSSGMPQTAIREKKDVDKLREDRIKAQQQQQQMAMQMQAGQELMKNANKLNEPIKQDSIMGQLNQQLAGGLHGGAQ